MRLIHGERGLVWNCELDGRVVRWSQGPAGGPHSQQERAFEHDEEARAFMESALARRRRLGFSEDDGGPVRARRDVHLCGWDGVWPAEVVLSVRGPTLYELRGSPSDPQEFEPEGFASEQAALAALSERAEALRSQGYVPGTAARLEDLPPPPPRLLRFLCEAEVPVQGPGDGGHLGGRPALRPDEAWPRCSTCARTATFLAELPAGGELVQVFTCASTSCTAGAWARRVSAQGRVAGRLPAGFKELAEVRFSRWERRIDLSAEALDPGAPLAPSLWERTMPRALESAWIRGTKRGGSPTWLQRPDEPLCTCGVTSTRFVLQVADDIDGLFFGTDSGTAYVFACDGCGATYLVEQGS